MIFSPLKILNCTEYLKLPYFIDIVLTLSNEVSPKTNINIVQNEKNQISPGHRQCMHGEWLCLKIALPAIHSTDRDTSMRPRQGRDYFTVPLHSPISRHLPADRAMQWVTRTAVRPAEGPNSFHWKNVKLEVFSCCTKFHEPHVVLEYAHF